MYTEILGNFFKNTIIDHTFRSASASASLCFLTIFNETYSPYYETGDEPTPATYIRRDVSGSWAIGSGSAFLEHSIEYDWLGTFASIAWFGVCTGSGKGNFGSVYFAYKTDTPRGNSAFDLDTKFYIDTDEKICILLGDGYENSSVKFSPYFSNKMLDHYLNGNIYIPPTNTLFMGLYNYDETSGSTEVNGTYYKRIPCGGTGSWTEPITGSTCNTGSYVFTNVNPDWGNIYGISIYDSETGGNSLITIGFDNYFSANYINEIDIEEYNIKIKIY